MHSIFGPGFPGLLEAFYVQERLMEYLMPEVYKSFVSLSPSALALFFTVQITDFPMMVLYRYHYMTCIDELLVDQQRNMISSSAWGTKWYITLFVNTVPFSQQLRLWDVLWYDGRDVMVMTSIAILWAFKGEKFSQSSFFHTFFPVALQVPLTLLTLQLDLLSAPTANFESILSLLSSYFVAEDENALMDWIRRMLDQQPLRRKMDGWRNEWLTLVAQGKSGTALL